jgi:hypothetical protein
MFLGPSAAIKTTDENLIGVLLILLWALGVLMYPEPAANGEGQPGPIPVVYEYRRAHSLSSEGLIVFVRNSAPAPVAIEGLQVMDEEYRADGRAVEWRGAAWREKQVLCFTISQNPVPPRGLADIRIKLRRPPPAGQMPIVLVRTKEAGSVVAMIEPAPPPIGIAAIR